MGNVGVVIMYRSYRFRPALVPVSSAEGSVSLRADVRPPVMLPEGEVTSLYVRYESVVPGEWTSVVVIASGLTLKGGEPVRVGEWSWDSIVNAPDWIRDFIADNEPSERIGS